MEAHISGAFDTEINDLNQWIKELGTACAHQLENAVTAFYTSDRAVQVWNRDDEIDSQFSRLITTLKAEADSDNTLVDSFADMLFIGRSCERSGDHLTNIAEDICYVRTGEQAMVQGAEK